MGGEALGLENMPRVWRTGAEVNTGHVKGCVMVLKGHMRS